MSEKARSIVIRYGAAVLIVAAATALRLVFLGALETRATYITFFPAVTLTALFCGLGPGLLATVLSGLAADYFWLGPVGIFNVSHPGDMLGMVVFVFSSSLISFICEAMHRARARAYKAEAELSIALERQKAEEKLHESQKQNEFLAGLISASSQPLGVGYPDGRLGLVNPAFEQLTGYKAEELRSINWAEVLTPPEWRQMEQEKLAILQRTGEPVRYQKEYIRKDGTRVPIELLVHLMKDSEGNPQYYYSFITDITDRRQAEESLRKSDARLRFALESSRIGAWDLDLEDHTAFRSLEHDSIFGYPQLLPEWTYEMFLDHVVPEDRAMVDSKFKHAVETQSGWSFECRIRRADGEMRWIWAAGRQHVDAAGPARIMSGIVQDITDRKAVEEARGRLSSIVEFSNDAILSKDLDGIIQSWNAGAEHIFGYSAEDIIGKPVTILIPPDRLDEEEQIVERIRSGQHVDHLDTVRLAKDGYPIPVSVTSSPIKDYAGRIVGTSKIIRDITERKRVEQVLRRTTKELARSNQDLEQFAYVASHDLQEPLRMVTGYLQLIDRRYKDKLDKDAQEFIEFAVDGAVRMSRLITDLLDYSRVNTRGKPPEPVPLEDVLKRTLENLRAAIRDSEAEISHDPLPTVQGDTLQLVQLFQNLVANAIKFRSPDRPLRVFIGAKKEDDRWVISVKDNGIGIEQQYAEKIFLIFQRLHSRGEYPGTGIGLAICKRIVERHGGRLWVESQLGQGSTFFFTINS